MLRVLSLLFASLFASSAAMALPVIGEPAPAISATNALTGKPLSLSDYKGKIVVLEWNNFGCPFVKKFYGSGTMQQLQADAVKEDVVWITINSSAPGKEGFLADNAAAKAAFSEHKAASTAYVLDHTGSIGHAYGAKSTPHMFVIDTNGMMAYMGAIDDTPTPDVADIANAKNYVTAAIASLKAGTPVEMASTRPYGCFVKY